MQKGFIQFIVLGIVALALVGAGAFYLGRQTTPRPQPQTSLVQPTISQPLPFPTPDETANWKTYTDTDGKYSIKYPLNYSLEENDSIKTAEKFPAGKKQIAIKPSDQKLNFIIYINYYPVPNLSQASEVMQQVSGCDKVNEQQTNAPKGKNFILDNQKAIMYEDSLCGQFTTTNFYALHNDRIYSISIASTEKYVQHQTVVGQILSTLKFTDQDQSEQRCGSAVGQCKAGYHCIPDSQLNSGPVGDTPGICVKD